MFTDACSILSEFMRIHVRFCGCHLKVVIEWMDSTDRERL
jgi:hypothetical protein